MNNTYQIGDILRCRIGDMNIKNKRNNNVLGIILKQYIMESKEIVYKIKFYNINMKKVLLNDLDKEGIIYCLEEQIIKKINK